MGRVYEELNIGGNFRNALRDVTALSRQASTAMSLLGTVANSIGVGFSIFAIMEMSDNVSMLNQRIKLATIGSEDFISVQSKLRNVAQETRASYESIATTYQKLGMQTKGVFATNDEIIEFTSNLQKLFTVSGMTQTGIESTMYNLTQSLSSGALMGQDYRILKQNAPQMIQILQDYYKVSRQELDNMVSKGKVSAQDIKNAMLDVSQGGMKEVIESFNQMPVTFSQAMTMLGNSIRAELEPMLLEVAKVAKFLANHIDVIVDALKVAVITIGMFNAKLIITKVLTGDGLLSEFVRLLSTLPALFMGSSAGASAFAFSLHGIKSALISTGIGAIPVIIGIAIVAVSKFIDAFGGLKAVLLKIKDIAIVVFENIAGFFARMIEGIVNTYRKVKSFLTGEKYEAYKIEVGVNEEAHQQRLREIEAEKEAYRKNKDKYSNGLGVELDSLSTTAQGQLTNSVRLADEDVKYISDLAERKYVMQVNLNTMPNVSINQNVNGNGASNLNDMEREMVKVLSQWNGASNIV